MSETFKPANEHEEFYIQEPQSPDVGSVYFRIRNQDIVEAWSTTANQPEQISMYDLWKATLEHDVHQADRNSTPWTAAEAKP